MTSRKDLEAKRLAKMYPDRRQFVKGMGVAGAFAFAGCLGDDDEDVDDGDDTTAPGDDDDGDDDPSVDDGDDDDTQRVDLPMVDQEYRTYHMHEDPGDPALPNKFWSVTWNLPWWIYEFVYSRPGYRKMGGEGWHSVLYEDVAIEPNEVTIKIADEATWSNGDPVTGDDFLNWYRIQAVRFRSESPEATPIADEASPLWVTRIPDGGDGDWRFDAMEADDKEATLFSRDGAFLDRWSEEAVRDTFYDYWQTDMASPDYQEDVDWMLDLDDPWEDEDEIEALEESILSKDYGGENEIGLLDAITHGPFEITEITETDYILERRDDHPHADKVNFPTIRSTYVGDDELRRTLLVNNELDTSEVSMGTHVIDSIPDEISEIRHIPRFANGIMINHADEQLGRREVRAALMHAINREEVADLATGPVAIEVEPVEYPGVHAGLRPFFDDDFLSQLNPYEYDLDRATTLLEGEGFSLEDGTWYTPDDEPWEIVMHTDSDIPNFENIVLDQLSRFGIGVQLQTEDGAAYEERREDGNFQMHPGAAWAAWENPQHAYREWQDIFTLDPRHGYGMWSEELMREFADEHDHVEFNDETGELEGWEPEDIYGWFELEIPEVGDPEGATWEYNWATRWDALNAQASYDGRDFQQLMEEGAWAYNYLVHNLPLIHSLEQKFHNTADWITPSIDDNWPWNYNIRYPLQMIDGGFISADPDGRGDVMD